MINIITATIKSIFFFLVLASPAAADTMFAIIGDFGNGSTRAGEVAGLVAGWNPEFVVTTGDNRYEVAPDYDEAVGQFYCEYLADAQSGPFCGGSNSASNAFFPSVGNHDYDDGNGVDDYLDYFTLPGAGIAGSDSSGNELYYDFVVGPVHFFAVDAEAALVSSSSRTLQRNWLQDQLAASTTPWQIVFMHRPPFSSSSVASHESNPELQWPYAAWGADALISGHAHSYERLLIDGIPQFVNGVGGVSLTEFGSPVAGSIVRYDGGDGAMRVQASDTEITYELINTQGALIDSYTDTIGEPQTYCEAFTSSQEYEHMARVQVADLDNSSGPSSYSDFTNLSASLTAGISNSASLTPGFSGSSYQENWKLWIDYNADLDFDDEGELAFTGSGNSVVNGSFTVPEDAAGIETRMRVIVEYESDPEACGGGQFGEVEDYTVQISTRPSQPPVADFSANATSLGEGEAVEFTDLSSGVPTSWDWSFSGGTPATSSDENPTVRYATAGTYAVTLTVANSDGSDSESKSAYITVVETPMVNYCNASGNSQQYEYIGGVEVGDMNQPSGPSAYSDFTNIVATLPAGESANVALTPQFSSDAYSEAWRIWIDYNGDGDFLDSGELVFSDTSTSDVTGSFVVPSSATGSTRMRVALQWQTPSNSCGSFDYGEVEDYSVQFASGT